MYVNRSRGCENRAIPLTIFVGVFVGCARLEQVSWVSVVSRSGTMLNVIFSSGFKSIYWQIFCMWLLIWFYFCFMPFYGWAKSGKSHDYGLPDLSVAFASIPEKIAFLFKRHPVLIRLALRAARIFKTSQVLGGIKGAPRIMYGPYLCTYLIELCASGGFCHFSSVSGDCGFLSQTV